MSKLRRFFFHYRRSDGQMSVHWKKQCIAVGDVQCNVPVETHRSKVQPFLVMRGWAKNITVENNKAVIE